jgi:hypothetical protein
VKAIRAAENDGGICDRKGKVEAGACGEGKIKNFFFGEFPMGESETEKKEDEHSA